MAAEFGGRAILAMALLLGTAACEPRVVLEAPKDPITINLNIKIEQEVRIKVERDLEQLFETDKKLF